MNKGIENIFHKMLYTCEQATFLIEKKASNDRLSCMENMRLKGHLAVCKLCRTYNQNIKVLDKAMSRLATQSSENIDEDEVKAFKKQLIEKTIK